jgi:hypothetical protein
LTAAQFEISTALSSDKIRVLVIELGEIAALESAAGFVSLLLRRNLQLTASGTYVPDMQ